MSNQNNIIKRSVVASNSEIQYYYSVKKVKNINLRIKPDGTVHVSASKSVPLEYVDNFVRSKSNFILEAVENFKKNMSLPQRLDDGDIMYFLGKSYIVRLGKRANSGASLSFENREFYIYLRDINDIQSRFNTLEGWQKFASGEIFPPIMKKMLTLFKENPIDEPTLRYRKMKSRWGSCHFHQKIITLSLMLTEVSVPAIEYVVLHELVHLFHPNHSKEFYTMVEKLMPDWKSRRQLLREHKHFNKADL